MDRGMSSGKEGVLVVGPVTEASSKYEALESMPLIDVLRGINAEDKLVPLAIEKKVANIEAFVMELVPRVREGGRLFYIGAGTSGRLGILDAAECPPTYGVDHGMVVGLMAGGDSAIRKAVEFAEDDSEQAWKDLKAHNINSNDTLVGVAASGRTPYVVGGLRQAQENGLLTACICCNPGSAVAKYSHHPIEIVVGPEFVTGSTRMKAGTAQKLVLNMISTSLMIQLGKVKGNRMIDMQLTNEKLKDRGARMVMQATGCSREEAEMLLADTGSVRAAIDMYHQKAP